MEGMARNFKRSRLKSWLSKKAKIWPLLTEILHKLTNLEKKSDDIVRLHSKPDNDGVFDPGENTHMQTSIIGLDFRRINGDWGGSGWMGIFGRAISTVKSSTGGTDGWIGLNALDGRCNTLVLVDREDYGYNLMGSILTRLTCKVRTT